MRAILVYRLPDEQGEYDAAITGSRSRSILWDIDQRLRAVIKYGEPTDAEARLAEEIRGMIPGDLLD